MQGRHSVQQDMIDILFTFSTIALLERTSRKVIRKYAIYSSMFYPRAEIYGLLVQRISSPVFLLIHSCSFRTVFAVP